MSFLDEWADDDDFSDGEDTEADRAPTFGCACESPIIVDSVCGDCISLMAEQARAANEEQAKADLGGGAAPAEGSTHG